MVKRSIEQDLRIRNFEARNGNYETNAVVKNQGTKQRGQRILGDCWQWESNGECFRGDNCSFRHDINKRGKMTQPNPSPSSFMQQNERNASRTRSPRGNNPSGRMSRWPCKDYLKGTCTNSFCEKWHPPECLFYKTKSGCKFGEKCSWAHRQVDEQPSKRSKKNDDKSAVAMLKKNDWHENVRQLVVNRDKSHERSVRLDKNRDTCHELKRRPTGRRSTRARHLRCVSRETNRQLQAAAFQSSFFGSISIVQMRICAEIYFLNSNHWVGILGFQRSGKLRLFLQDARVKRTTHANRMLRALEWIQACFGVETHFSAVLVRRT